jgi:glycosyltransferase involved in cell wall biosynthesis
LRRDPLPDAGRVLVATAHYGRDGGIGAHVLSSVRVLREAGWNVEVVSGTVARDVAIEDAPRSLIGFGDKRAPSPTAARFASLVRDLEPGLVHFHDIRDPGLVASVLGQVPTAWSVHGYLGSTSGYKYFRRPEDVCARPHGAACIPNLLFRGCSHRRDLRPLAGDYRRTTKAVQALRSADAAMPCSRFVADHLLSNEVRRVHVATPFVDPLPEPSPIPSTPRILFAGRITPHAKGIGVILRAMSRLDVELDVCGDGWWLPQARSLAAELGIEHKVRFHGWLDEERLAAAYREASVVAMPSLWPEPFGLAGVEGMAHGRPVVASRTGGIPEWHDGDAVGALVPPGDVAALARALERLISDRDLCVRLGEAARGRVADRFTRHTYLASACQVYELLTRGEPVPNSQ